jgi:hypothetical protein
MTTPTADHGFADILYWSPRGLFAGRGAAPAATAAAKTTKYLATGLPSGNWRFEVPAGTQVHSAKLLIRFHPRTRKLVKPSGVKDGDMKSAAEWANEQGLLPSVAAEKVCANYDDPESEFVCEVRKETEKDFDVQSRPLEITAKVPADIKAAFVKELQTEMNKQSGAARAEEARRKAAARQEETRIKALKGARKETEVEFKKILRMFLMNEKAKWAMAGVAKEDMAGILLEVASICKTECAKHEPPSRATQAKKRRIDDAADGAGPAQ